MNMPRNSWKNTNNVMKCASVLLNKGLSCQSKEHSPKMCDAILEVTLGHVTNWHISFIR